MSKLPTVAPLAEQEKAQTSTPLGLYLHVPFCATTCDFCAFYQVRPEGDDLDRYIETVAAELALLPAPLPADTVFWGGGTPGLLPAKHLSKLASVLRSSLASDPAEWTVEMAPTTVTAERLAALKDAGVTRISMGAQSFQPALLEALGRRHSLAQVLRAYELIRAAEFRSVNLDLIFAIPGQDAALWKKDLEEAAALAPDHLSTYCLTFEEDTALFIKLSQGKVSLDPEKEAAFYHVAWETLGAAGYAQYEISNYARPGHACAHNLHTWQMHEWVGVGPSAASQFAGSRGANPPDLALWRADIASGKRATSERVPLTPELLAADALVFGLRCNAGVDFRALEQRFPDADWATYKTFSQKLIAEKLATIAAPNVLQLTPQGRLLADAIGSELLAL